MQQLDVEMRIERIETEPQLQMAIGDSRELNVAVVPAEAGAGKTLRLLTTSNQLVEMSANEVVLDAEGKATVTVTGKTEGSTNVMLTIDNELAEEMVVVDVKNPDYLLVERPDATPGSGWLLEPGEMVTLTTRTEGAQIYYTTDGSCPCDEQGSRQLYTEPIVITGETVIKAMAVKDGWTDSDVATFVYGVNVPEGISDTRVSTTVPVQLYDLQGRRVSATQAHKGLYIVVGGGDSKPRKTIMK